MDDTARFAPTDREFNPALIRVRRAEPYQPVLFRRLEGASEFGSPARLWTRSRRDVSIAARLIRMDARIGGKSSSLPTCSAIVASARDCSLRTSCSLLSTGLGAVFWRRLS